MVSAGQPTPCANPRHACPRCSAVTCPLTLSLSSSPRWQVCNLLTALSIQQKPPTCIGHLEDFPIGHLANFQDSETTVAFSLTWIPSLRSARLPVTELSGSCNFSRFVSILVQCGLLPHFLLVPSSTVLDSLCEVKIHSSLCAHASDWATAGLTPPRVFHEKRRVAADNSSALVHYRLATCRIATAQAESSSRPHTPRRPDRNPELRWQSLHRQHSTELQSPRSENGPCCAGANRRQSLPRPGL